MENKILAKVSQIAHVLLNKNEDSLVGLMGGETGIALFLFYYARMTDEQRVYDLALDKISKALDKINEGFNFHTHAGGLAGFGTAMEILIQEDFIEADSNDLLDDLDEYLYELMLSELVNKNYDFLHGAIGLALYFHKRKSCKNREKYLLSFVEGLEKIAEKDKDGFKWLSVINHDKNTKGYNLSLSHGIASIISILSKLTEIDICRKKVEKLLCGSINYLLDKQLDVDVCRVNFPNWISEEDFSNSSRLAWCYGDLGIALALWQAGNNLHNNDWKQRAEKILLHSTQRRDLLKNSVYDAGICHGTAGIAHIYMRMYTNTGMVEFKDAANYWYQNTLKMAKFEDGLAGYKVFRLKDGEKWETDYGLIEGIAGIGLSLISSVSDIKPSWDECFLIS